MKVFEFFLEVIGWIGIALSPFLIGLIIGGIIYYNLQDTVGIVIGILVTISGLLIGILVATKAWKGKGTIYFLSRISATPELDKEEKVE